MAGGGASLRLNLYMLERAGDGSLMEISELWVGSRCAKGLGVGTRFAFGKAVGNRDCEGGQFSLLLEKDGRFIVGGLSFIASWKH